MKIRFVSMRKYNMLLGWRYRLRNIFSFRKYWKGEIWQFRFLCEYGFDIDFRKGNIFENMKLSESQIETIIEEEDNEDKLWNT